MSVSYPKLEIKRKTGLEQFHRQGQPLGFQLIDFWQWYSSDLASNATRGCLAEFIVASALGLGRWVREEWSAVDLVTDRGIKVEVKSAAYLQTWEQKSLSPISFAIRATRAWNYVTGGHETELKRHADI